MDYVKADKVSLAMNESNDCSVKALAILTDTAYKVAHAVLADLGRKPRKGAVLYDMFSAVRMLGWKREEVTDSVTAKTVKKIASDPVFSHGHFLIYTSGHVVAVKNGKVEDWSEDRALRIKQVWKIEPNASRKERKQLIDAVAQRKGK